ncbi:MAG: magnesium chelatase domain-containing protein, partial [Melioribacter sp.]|nr:magnesium chelatase domain-containing protein [Melioribacter sp.]
RIEEPAVDLAVCCAIASSYANRFAKNSTVVIGEVGLGGEVRSVNSIEKRIQEAYKLGFKSIVVPNNNYKSLNIKNSIEIIPVENIISALKQVLSP